jgi:hypothetical protein
MKPIDDKTLLEKFTGDFVRVVERHAKYIIVSGFVAILHGRSRGTEDIDMVVEKLSLPKFEKLHKDLVKTGFECLQSDNPQDIYGYLNNNSSVRYVQSGTLVPQMEIKFARDLIDEGQIRTRKKLPLTGTDFYFPSIESAIAFKEELLKSEKDLADARHLRIIYKDSLNESEISRVKKEIIRLRL